jgi:hypothetical protein
VVLLSLIARSKSDFEIDQQHKQSWRRTGRSNLVIST